MEDIPCSWIGSFNIVMLSILSKFIHRSNTHLCNPSKAFYGYRYGYSKIYMERTTLAKIVLKGKN